MVIAIKQILNYYLLFTIIILDIILIILDTLKKPFFKLVAIKYLKTNKK